ncbi:hypothetical protein CRM22_008707, partial [Opisthorchis felineus]
WNAFYDKARRFMTANAPNMTLLGEIRKDADSFGKRTKDMVEFRDPTVKYETSRIKSFPRSLLKAVFEAALTQTSADNTVMWGTTFFAIHNRSAVRIALDEENRKHNASTTFKALA